ncbi:MAG: TRAP transporter substrate-binding protein [Rhizobiaceae bacterium]|nr:TRAP transporter substrate-binding protein [Rhizobiaceae bacterium]
MRLFNLVFRCVALSGALLPAAALAQTSITAIGGFSNQYQNVQIEKPFFETLPEKTGGAFKVNFRSINELGMKGFDAFRQLRSGAFDIMAISPGYVSGDDPFVLGLDLPGIMPKLETARAAIDSYRAPLATRINDRFGGHVLAIWPYPAQMLFCKGEMNSLEDLKGKKVRVFSSALSDLVANFGATGVSLPFSEVYPSLQRGVIDCAVTASLSGNEAKWFEVTDTLYTLPISWALQLHVANGAFWDGLSDEDKATLTEQFGSMEDQMWSVAQQATVDGVNCSTGTQPCEIGTSAKMVLSPFGEADEAALIEAVSTAVLPSWGKECDAAFSECTSIWNDTVGKATGYSIK